MNHSWNACVLLGCISAAILCCLPNANGESPYQISWTRQVGTSGGDAGLAAASDALGNVYMGGITRGSLFSALSEVQDAFLIKYDTAGNVLWGRQFGATNAIDAYSIAVDNLGNPYVTGGTGGPDGSTFDAHLRKYDSAGNLLWSHQLGTSTRDYSYSIAVDIAGNACIGGQTFGSLAGPNAGESDAFISKYDTFGNQLWTRQFGTSGSDTASAVAMDANGNSYVTGPTSGNLGGINAGSNDVFLSKYDSSGTQLWSRQIGTSGYDAGNAVKVDALGNAYVSGRTDGNLGGPYAGSEDLFLAKYDPSGSQLWIRHFGTSATDAGGWLGIDGAGNLHLSGYNPGVDNFIIKYDSAGNQLLTSHFAPSDTGTWRTEAVDLAGNLYFSGTVSQSGSSLADAYFVKLSPTVVPEPGSLALLVIGTIGLPFYWRRLSSR